MLAVEGTAIGQRLFSPNKISQVVQYIERFYVEDQDMDKIMDKGIESMLQELDPHSVYIPKRDVQKANEPLDGSFVGVGIAFQLVKDTINVVEVIHGGPAEKVGLLPGDKVVKVDDNPAVGDSITNKWVYDHLRGKKNTRVKLGVKRSGAANMINFDIQRDEVPINSVNTYFMIDKEVGYIALSRFSRTSAKEVRDAIADLKAQGMQSLVFDLRSNSGGFLDIAAEIVDEFLPADQLIVYTEGKSHDRQVMKSTAKGSFETGRLVVLIDEY
jgi:carboxyl-terminal processing protease